MSIVRNTILEIQGFQLFYQLNKCLAVLGYLHTYLNRNTARVPRGHVADKLVYVRRLSRVFVYTSVLLFHSTHTFQHHCLINLKMSCCFISLYLSIYNFFTIVNSSQQRIF